LFYAATELRSKTFTLYDRLERVNIDWNSVFAPLNFAFCESNGRPTDPVVYGKCFLIAFFEDVERDTDLASRVSDSLSIRKFLFGSYAGMPPDHSSLSRVRATIAEHCDLNVILHKTVDLLKANVMVIDEAFAMDTTLIPSRARRCFEPINSPPTQTEGGGNGADAAPKAPQTAQTPTATDVQAAEPEVPPAPKEHEEPRQTPEPKMMSGLSEPNPEILEAEEAASKKPGKKKQEPKKKLVPSPYDPEALIARKPGFKTQPCYKIGAAVDYKSRAVLAVDAYSSTMGEGQCMRNLYADLVRTSGETPKYVVADAGMDDAAFHATVELFGATPVTGLQANTSIASGYGKDRFLYNPDRDIYICPAGEVLGRKNGPDALRPAYAASLTTCRECPLMAACFGSIKGPKTINRSCDEASRDRVVAARNDPYHEWLLRKRQAKIEPLFSDFKEHGGLSQIYTKGLPSARVKAKVAGIGQNIKLLLKLLETGVTAKLNPKEPTPAMQGAVIAPEGLLLNVISAMFRILSSNRRLMAFVRA
jgi:hypothetical protein